MTSDNVKAFLIVGASLAALFLVYKTVSVVSSGVSAVGDAVDGVVDTVSNFVGGSVNTVSNSVSRINNVMGDSLAEFQTIFSPIKIYGPTALSGSMSYTDALALQDYHNSLDPNRTYNP